MAYEEFVPIQKYKFVEFVGMLKRLFPRGPIWNFSLGGSNIVKMLEPFALELERFSQTFVDLMKESVPGLSTDSGLLTDWERIAGLPDSCSPLADTESQRQQVVHNKIFAKYPGLTEQFFLDYAAGLNMTVTITQDPVGDVFRTSHKDDSSIQRVTHMPTGDIDGSRLNSSLSVYSFKVEVDTDPDGNQDILECIFNKFKPAFSQMTFVKLP